MFTKTAAELLEKVALDAATVHAVKKDAEFRRKYVEKIERATGLGDSEAAARKLLDAHYAEKKKMGHKIDNPHWKGEWAGRSGPGAGPGRSGPGGRKPGSGFGNGFNQEDFDDIFRRARENRSKNAHGGGAGQHSHNFEDMFRKARENARNSSAYTDYSESMFNAHRDRARQTNKRNAKIFAAGLGAYGAYKAYDYFKNKNKRK